MTQAKNGLQFRKNLNHPTLPEIMDFNALGEKAPVR